MEKQTREWSERERSEQKRKLMNKRRGRWKEKEEAGLEMEFSLEAGMRQWVPLKNKLAVGDHHRHDYRKATQGPFRCVSNTKQQALCSPVAISTVNSFSQPVEYPLKTPTGEMYCFWWTLDYNELLSRRLFLITDRQDCRGIITIGSC